MHASDPAADAFLNETISRLYARAREPDPSPTDGGLMVVDHPAEVDRILKSPETFGKNYSLLSALGQSRFSAGGATWEARRDLTQASYLQAAQSGNRRDIYAIYRDVLSNCENTSPAAIRRALLEAAVAAFFRAFDCAVEAGPLLDLFARVRPILKTAQYLSWIGAGDTERLHLVDTAKKALEDFSAETEKSPDLIMLMARFRHEAHSIPHFVPHEELLMNFFAGIETPAATLGWAITCLGADPRIQQRLYEEVLSDADATPYLDCYVNETMRYFPPIPFVIREAASAATLNGVELKSGSLVLLSIVGVHHHRDYWKEPEAFHSARPEFLENSYDRRAFIPFLTGPRMCGGARLARLELVEGLKAFVRLFSVSGGTDRFSFDYGLAMRPNSWTHIEIKRRN